MIRGIRHQAFRLVFIPTITIALLLAVYFTYTRFQDLEQNFSEHSEAIALKLAPASEYAVFTRNKTSLQDLAQTALKKYKVKSVTFYTEKGVEMVSSGQKPSPFTLPTHRLLIKEKTEASLFITIPLQAYQTTINHQTTDLPQPDILAGWLKIEFDRTSIRLREYQVLIEVGLILLLGLGLLVLQAFRLDQKIIHPIIALAQVTKRIREENFTTSIDANHIPELQELILGMNTLAEALQDAKSELQHKVDQATASLRRSLETIDLQNAELKHARQAAETASQIKSEFLADMSHEIRTPLNAVVGFIHLLQKTELDEIQTQYLNTLKKSSHTLLSIINDILDFSKIETGKLHLESSIVHIRECVEESLNLLAPYANEKSLSLIPLFYSDIPDEALGDPLRIKQVVTNLVSNSIKFTEKGSILVRVRVEKAHQNRALIRISVTDTGMGLSPAEQQALRQVFEQTKVDPSNLFDGKGLGLTISKKLVEQMKGKIGLKSEHGKGSTFWFTFEVEVLESVFAGSKFTDLRYSIPPATSSSTHFTHSLSPPPSLLTSLSCLHILAVDDNLENLQLVGTLLKDLGAQVTSASSGQEALKIVMNKANRFNLILMDIRMPGMNGIEATQAIRNFESRYQLQYTPIIALTAHAFISEREELFSAGMDDCLAKPVNEKTLEKVIQKWVLGNLSSSSVSFNKEPNETTQKPQGKFQDNISTSDVISTATSISTAPSVDWELALKLAGGKQDLSEELLAKLIKGLSAEQRQIQQAFQAQDWQMFRDTVHRLHGACCYCGVPKLKQATAKLEVASETQDSSILEPLMKKLDQAIKELRNEWEQKSSVF